MSLEVQTSSELNYTQFKKKIIEFLKKGSKDSGYLTGKIGSKDAKYKVIEDIANFFLIRLTEKAAQQPYPLVIKNRETKFGTISSFNLEARTTVSSLCKHVIKEINTYAVSQGKRDSHEPLNEPTFQLLCSLIRKNTPTEKPLAASTTPKTTMSDVKAYPDPIRIESEPKPVQPDGIPDEDLPYWMK